MDERAAGQRHDDRGSGTLASPTAAPPLEGSGRLAAGSVVWVVPGPLGQATGGYLYDARMVNELAILGWEVGVLDVGARAWPLDPVGAGVLVHALGQRVWDAVVFDELAHPVMAAGVPWLRAAGAGAALVGLVHHLRASEPAPVGRRWLAQQAERAALARLDRVVCTSQYTAGTVRDLLGGGTPIDVVPPGFDTQTIDVAAAGPSARSAGEPGRLRVLMVAHWTPRKGILTALRALAQAPSGVTLDLVGDSTRDPAYARRVVAALRHPSLAGRVLAHGVVPTERLAELYAEADAFLLTSTHEGYGMVLAEALRAGLPIVATRVGAVPDLLREDSGAELVAGGDAGSIARALRRLADDPAARARRAALAAARGRTLPTWRESAAEFDRVLREAVDARTAPDRRAGSISRVADVGGRHPDDRAGVRP